MGDDGVTTKHCRCDARNEAVRHGIFLPRTDGLWVITTARLRRVNPKKAREARERSLDENHKHPWENCHGEQYTFECCPWCGHDLPILPPGINGTRAQSDGDQGEGPE